jgi:hypothetical protein
MAYNFHQRLRHTDTRMDELLGEVITITRGAFSTTSRGARHLKRAQEMQPGIAITRIEIQDWAIDVAKYQVNGVVVAPLEGDIITGANGDTFLVSAVGDEVWIYTSSLNKRLIVHTVRQSQG